ncbi:MAG: hypothetical protein FIB03_06845 [Anaerolineae bacterium]|nr:hypothetical protein [Anaerolineae bacterium]
MNQQANMEMSQTNFRKPEPSFYVGWIALTSLSVPLAFFFSLIVLKIVTNVVWDFIVVNGIRHITEDYLLMYVFVPFIGLSTGALQYVLLRKVLPRMGWWVPATVGGWLLGVFLLALPGWLGWTGTPPDNLDLVFLVMGLAIGTAQWVLLQRRLARAGWWIAANILGWGLLGLTIPGNTLDQYGLFTLGLVPACATAAMLALYISRVPFPSTGPGQ